MRRNDGGGETGMEAIGLAMGGGGVRAASGEASERRTAGRTAGRLRRRAAATRATTVVTTATAATTVARRETAALHGVMADSQFHLFSIYAQLSAICTKRNENREELSR